MADQGNIDDYFVYSSNQMDSSPLGFNRTPTVGPSNIHLDLSLHNINSLSSSQQIFSGSTSLTGIEDFNTMQENQNKITESSLGTLFVSGVVDEMLSSKTPDFINHQTAPIIHKPDKTTNFNPPQVTNEQPVHFSSTICPQTTHLDTKPIVNDITLSYQPYTPFTPHKSPLTTYTRPSPPSPLQSVPTSNPLHFHQPLPRSNTPARDNNPIYGHPVTPTPTTTPRSKHTEPHFAPVPQTTPITSQFMIPSSDSVLGSDFTTSTDLPPLTILSDDDQSHLQYLNTSSSTPHRSKPAPITAVTSSPPVVVSSDVLSDISPSHHDHFLLDDSKGELLCDDVSESLKTFDDVTDASSVQLFSDHSTEPTSLLPTQDPWDSMFRKSKFENPSSNVVTDAFAFNEEVFASPFADSRAADSSDLLENWDKSEDVFKMDKEAVTDDVIKDNLRLAKIPMLNHSKIDTNQFINQPPAFYGDNFRQRKSSAKQLSPPTSKNFPTPDRNKNGVTFPHATFRRRHDDKQPLQLVTKDQTDDDKFGFNQQIEPTIKLPTSQIEQVVLNKNQRTTVTSKTMSGCSYADQSTYDSVQEVMKLCQHKNFLQNRLISMKSPSPNLPASSMTSSNPKSRYRLQPVSSVMTSPNFPKSRPKRLKPTRKPSMTSSTPETFTDFATFSQLTSSSAVVTSSTGFPLTHVVTSNETQLKRNNHEPMTSSDHLSFAITSTDDVTNIASVTAPTVAEFEHIFSEQNKPVAMTTTATARNYVIDNRSLLPSLANIKPMTSLEPRSTFNQKPIQSNPLMTSSTIKHVTASHVIKNATIEHHPTSDQLPRAPIVPPNDRFVLLTKPLSVEKPMTSPLMTSPLFVFTNKQPPDSTSMTSHTRFLNCSASQRHLPVVRTTSNATSLIYQSQPFQNSYARTNCKSRAETTLTSSLPFANAKFPKPIQPQNQMTSLTLNNVVKTPSVSAVAAVLRANSAPMTSSSSLMTSSPVTWNTQQPQPLISNPALFPNPNPMHYDVSNAIATTSAPSSSGHKNCTNVSIKKKILEKFWSEPTHLLPAVHEDPPPPAAAVVMTTTVTRPVEEEPSTGQLTSLFDTLLQEASNKAQKAKVTEVTSSPRATQPLIVTQTEMTSSADPQPPQSVINSQSTATAVALATNASSGDVIAAADSDNSKPPEVDDDLASSGRLKMKITKFRSFKGQVTYLATSHNNDVITRTRHSKKKKKKRKKKELPPITLNLKMIDDVTTSSPDAVAMTSLEAPKVDTVAESLQTEVISACEDRNIFAIIESDLKNELKPPPAPKRRLLSNKEATYRVGFGKSARVLKRNCQQNFTFSNKTTMMTSSADGDDVTSSCRKRKSTLMTSPVNDEYAFPMEHAISSTVSRVKSSRAPPVARSVVNKLIDTTAPPRGSRKKRETRHQRAFRELLSCGNPIGKYKPPSDEVITCKECGDSFISSWTFADHQERKSLIIKLLCATCDQQFVFHNRCALLTHARHHVEQQQRPMEYRNVRVAPLTSAMCKPRDRKFYLRQLQSKTSAKMTSLKEIDDSVACSECHVTCADVNELRRHFQRRSEARKCHTCHLQLNNACMMTSHTRMHSGMTPHTCPECGAVYQSSESGFNLHLRLKCFHNAKVDGYKCSVCNKFFLSYEQLQTHVLKHFKIFLKCSNCCKAFATSEILCNHRKTCRTSPTDDVTDDVAVRLLMCQVCEKAFVDVINSRQVLIDHFMSKHLTTNVTSGFQCYFCSSVFGAKSDFQKHLSVVHDMSSDVTEDAGVDVSGNDVTDNNLISSNGGTLHEKSEKETPSEEKMTEEDRTKKSARMKTTCRPARCHLHPGKRPPSLNHHISKMTSPSVDNSEADFSSLKLNEVNWCARCGFRHRDRLKFQEHIATHARSNSVQCSECGLCLASLHSLRNHLFIKHKIKNQNLLQMFNDKLRRDAMTSSLASLSSTDENSPSPRQRCPLFRCKVCSRTFSCDLDFRTHTRTHGLEFVKSSKKSSTMSPAS